MSEHQLLSLEHLTPDTPMGGNLLPSGQRATLRVWAPAAREVRLLWEYEKNPQGVWINKKTGLLQPKGNGFWGGFVPGLKDQNRYMYYVVGPPGGTEGLKRDPYARDLTDDPAWPECQCLLVDRFSTLDGAQHLPEQGIGRQTMMSPSGMQGPPCFGRSITR